MSFPLERDGSNKSSSNFGQIVRQTRFFNFGMATGLEKEKLWIQAC